MRRILILTADRAEKGLVEPIFSAFSLDNEARICQLNSRDSPIVNLPKLGSQLFEFLPNIVLVPCDRSEMVYAAAYCFHQAFIVAHLHAGNNSANHPDDLNRRAISCFSHILFCHSEEHKQNLINQGEEAWRCHVVGSTALDDIEIDDSITPKYPFDLVVLHPDPESEENTRRNLAIANYWVKAPSTVAGIKYRVRSTIWIAPNHDKNWEIIELSFSPHDEIYWGIRFYKSLPRKRYLSLLKNCQHAIGNSSSFYYELPLLGCSTDKVIHIGERNKGLAVPKPTLGASEKIAEILATIEINDKLRNKRLIT